MKNKKILISILCLFVCLLMLSSCDLLFAPIFSTDSSSDSSSNSSGVGGGFNTSTNTDTSTDTNNTNNNVEVVSIANAYINDKGELVLVYTNGTEQNLGVVVGKDGDVNVSISGSGSDVGFAVSKAIKSCVNIFSSFTTGSGFNQSTYGSSGSGVIFKIANGKAFIITNYHVVSAEVQDNLQGTIYTESAVIKVYLYGTEDISGSNILGYDFGSIALTAQYIGGSANYDLALIKISGEDFDKALTLNPYIEEISFADSSNLQLGETAIAIGNAMGKGIGVTKGIVSINNEDINPFISGSTRKLTCIRTYL